MEDETNSLKNGESKKAEDDVNEQLNKRRETRRRNILDNAKARMEKLGVRSNHHDNQHNAFFEYPDPEVEPNEIKFNFSQRPTMFTAPTATSTETPIDPFADEEPPKEYITFKYRLHVLLSVVLTYILALVGFIDNMSYLSVFVPTGFCVALELILKPPRQINPLIALAVTLCNLSTHYANIAWSLLSIAYDLVIDLGLSVFSIVSLTLIYGYLSGNSLATLQ